MTDVIKKNLEFTLLVVSVLGGLAGVVGLVGAFVILPYRVEAMERKLNVVDAAHTLDHDMLMRIEERLIAVQTTLARKP